MQNAPQPDLKAADDDRLAAARAWASECLKQPLARPIPVSGDASLRRYFRIQTPERALILMDAPPQQEDLRPFVDIALRLRAAGLHAPQVLHFSLPLGFGLLEDLGDRLYRDVLDRHTVDRLFPGLLECLVQMAREVDHDGLPTYDDDRLQAELDLFTDWYLLHHRKYHLSAAGSCAWASGCEILRRSAREQPRVFVHRDFHSCNLLYRDGRQPGVIDFQDAVSGPLSYDFVSLIWDRYIRWPRQQLEQWMESFRRQAGFEIDAPTWKRWCDLMGLQRNLKIVGIFARLHYRDHRPAYLAMIPHFYAYLLDVSSRYPELATLYDLLREPRCAP